MSVGITKTEGVLGGKARVEGHRISVLDIVELLDTGYSTSEAAEELGLGYDEVQAALKYYRFHREEIEEQAQQRDALYEELVETSRAPQ